MDIQFEINLSSFTLQSDSKNSDELPPLDVVNGKLWPCTLAEIQRKKKTEV